MPDEEKEIENLRRSENSRLVNAMKNISLFQVVLIVSLPLGAWYMYSTDKLTKNLFYIIITILLGVILFLLYRPDAKQKLLPEHILVKLAEGYLERKRKIGKEIPFDAQIFIMLAKKAKRETDATTGESGLVSWHMGFEIVHHNLRKTGVIEMNPYTGAVTGFDYPMPLGYTGRETRDVKIVPAVYLDSFKDGGQGKF